MNAREPPWSPLDWVWEKDTLEVEVPVRGMGSASCVKRTGREWLVYSITSELRFPWWMPRALRDLTTRAFRLGGVVDFHVTPYADALLRFPAPQTFACLANVDVPIHIPEHQAPLVVVRWTGLLWCTLVVHLHGLVRNPA